MDRRKFPACLTRLGQKKQEGGAALSRLRRRFCQACHSLPKAQKCIVIIALLEFFWIAALQFQVYELADTVSTQRVRIAQLEKQAKKQNNMLYSASQTLDDIEKKWHRLNFRVLENTWRIEEPAKDPDAL